MSCTKQCFDKDDKYYQHANCSTCVGQDSGKWRDGKNYCAACNTWHEIDNWPHPPSKEEGKYKIEKPTK